MEGEERLESLSVVAGRCRFQKVQLLTEALARRWKLKGLGGRES